MKVFDKVESVEKDMTTEELVEQMAHNDRQVYLLFHEEQKGFEGLVIWDEENWVCISPNKYLRSFSRKGTPTDDGFTYNNTDIKGEFLPENADEVILG